MLLYKSQLIFILTGIKGFVYNDYRASNKTSMDKVEIKQRIALWHSLWLSCGIPGHGVQWTLKFSKFEKELGTLHRKKH